MKTAAGVTLVEMLVAATAALSLLAAVAAFSRSQTRAFERESRHLRLRESSRRLLGTIAREIRVAGFAPVAGFDGERDGLAIAASDHLELRSDQHGASSGNPPDGALDPDSDERIGFVLNSTRGVVSQTIGRQSNPLTLDGMVPRDGLVFRYFDACDDEIAVPPSGELVEADRRRVRRVAIRLTVREGTRETITNETAAALRNRAGLRCE